ncbi:MAG: helix-hairpin-helix domain-containing protein [Pedobacter sp.]|uniref:ComEA family DNA-binding protein n=1 Tax=Pedobacter sp. TaxID=1411316 RepID=UPI002806B3DB|nr:helix-hairpin-helix domain-containing protein [Pedobacter sp.]MDQ8004905.1 helix-hairpin-helix domain-containing protein [Pedobacter sp.]
MKNWLINNFGFSKREYNGLLYLLLLILLVTFTPYIYQYYRYKNQISTPQEKLALQKLELVDRYHRKKYENTRNEIEGSNLKQPVRYFPFDPNVITEKEWQQFGLSYKQAMSIVNYVKKGGKFYKPEDLKKIYTISPEKYEALLPYVSISKIEQPDKKPASTYTKKEPIIVDINAADTLELDKIKGVGAAFARRIVKYRERLGGFYAKEQLFEVFGVDTPKFIEIKDQVKIDLDGIKKIDINKVEFDDLKRHPYLTFKQMNAIIQYRKQHGPYKSITDLNKVLILKSEVIQKMAPYLEFN